MRALTAFEGFAVIVIAAGVGVLLARFFAYRGVRPGLTVNAAILICLVTFAVRLALGLDTENGVADALVGIGAGLSIGAAAYARYDHWQDARRLRLEREANEVLKDMVVTGPEPRDPRDLQPGEPAIRVMPRAMERAIKRKERRERRGQR